MAPIPLTLLGIIPAHFIVFKLGLGGEFTATSMIGWIALAGIIVRNSILLVDFSLHEIRAGTPVAEAVILACKVRTRPILITALALVAGSSVIITDPIFQGMAISLLAGTIVSTVLTLIVIPLGCVSRAGDLCAVAAATAGHPLPCQAEVSVTGSSMPKAAGGGGLLAGPDNDLGQVLVNVLGKVWEVLTLVFYAVRGLLILLYDLAKNAFKSKPPPRPRRPRPSPQAPADAGPGVAPVPVVSGQDAGVTGGSVDTGPAAVVAAGSDGSARRPRSALVMGPSAGALSVTVDQGLVQTPDQGSTPVVASPDSDPSAGAGVQVGDDGLGLAEGRTLPKADAAAAGPPSSRPVKKRSPRRGIRLKGDDEPKGDTP